jgi:hypothetical protein
MVFSFVVVTSCVFVGPSIVCVTEIVSVDVRVLRIVLYEVRHSVWVWSIVTG